MSKQLCPISDDRVDPDAAKVVRRLVHHDYEAYLVGGCVRDLLLGRKPKDFDVSTSATPTEIKSLFRNSRIIGRRFRLAHIFFGPKIIETSTFRAPPLRQDPAEDEEEDLLIWQDNAFGTAEEDALRRDFTINGLFFDLERDRVIDWVNGLDDLRARRVRTIGDPDLRFQEDPIRILRAIKFAARLDLTIDPATAGAIVTHRGLIARCSIARILEEIYRLLHSGTAEVAFRMMHELGVLPVLLPELAALVGPATDERARGPVPAVRAGQRRAAASAKRPPHRPASRRDLARRPANAADHQPPAADATEGSPPAPSAERDRGPVMDPSDPTRLLVDLGLGEPGIRHEASTDLWTHLAALDELVRRLREPPSHAMLLAAPLCALARPALDGSSPTNQSFQRLDLLVESLATRLQVSRRDRELLRQTLLAQRRMAHGNPRRQMVQRDCFADAFQLLELRHRATGGFGRELSVWRELLGRRRGRRRRGRRRPAADGQDRNPVG